MVLGSDVPLEEDILRRKKDFVQTQLEWVPENRLQVIETTIAGGTILTVDAKSTFFLTGVAISGSNSSTTNGGFVSLRDTTTGAVRFIFRLALGIVGGTGTNDINGFGSITFPMPLKFEGGTRLIAETFTGATIALSIYGWIQPKKID